MNWEMCVKFDSEIIALSRWEGKEKDHRGSSRGCRKHMEMGKNIRSSEKCNSEL